MTVIQYSRRVSFLIAFLMIYPLCAYFGPRDGRAEFYPFFNWSLFTNASDIRTDVVLMIHEVNGKALAEPALFYDMKDQFGAAERRDSRLAKLIGDYAAGRFRNQNVLENVIFNRYMPEVQSIAYDVAVIQYRPDVRYRTGEIMRTKVIHSVEANR